MRIERVSEHLGNWNLLLSPLGRVLRRVSWRRRVGGHRLHMGSWFLCQANSEVGARESGANCVGAIKIPRQLMLGESFDF